MGEHEIGAELRAALQARGCALNAAEARDLSAALIALIDAGLLVTTREAQAEAVHGPRARSSAGSVDGSGGRVETAPAYNMGQSNYGEDEE